MKWIATLFFVLAAGASHAETVPAKGAVDTRIRTAHFNADEIYKLYGVVGYFIELILEDGEVFTGKASGDPDALDIDTYQNHVQIRPKAAVIDTNLTIYTNRRAYRFNYTAVTEAPSRYSQQTMYAVRFAYPPMPQVVAEDRAQQKVESAFAQASMTRPRNIDYWFCGKRSIKPTVAFDDGVHTRLSFHPRTELPAVFARNDDGTESLLNFHIENGEMVIHRIAREFILRRGRLTGCIVNKSYGGSGDRLESGTVSPAVERQRKELGP